MGADLKKAEKRATLTGGETPPRLMAAAAGLLCPCIIFVSVPNAVILGNLGAIAYDAGLVLMALGAFLTCSAVCMLLGAHGSRIAWARALSRVAIGLGLSIFAWNVLRTVWRVGPQDLSASAFRDALGVLVAAVVVTRAPWHVLVRVTGAVALLLLFVEVAMHGVRVADAHEGGRPDHRRNAGTAAHAGTGGNVYHVLLDAFQGESFPLVLEQYPELALSDFTYYPNFSSGYLYTRLAWNCMNTGRFWEGTEPFADWMAQGRQGGYIGELALSDIDVTIYPLYPEWCPPGTKCISHSTVEAVAHERRLDRALLVDLWFVSLMPASLEVALGSSGVPWEELPQSAVMSNWQGFSVTHEIKRAINSTSTTAAVASIPPTLVRWEALLSDEAERPSEDQYVLFHSLLPHVPYRVDADCALTGRRSGDFDAAIAQTACAVRMLGRLVQTLRQLDRYDNATIIVHGDHGMHPVQGRHLRHHFPAVVADNFRDGVGEEKLQVLDDLAQDRGWLPGMWEEDYTDWATAPGIAFRSSSVLLVKWPGQTGFKTDPSWRSMIDLAPTILSAMQRPHASYPGVPIHLDREEFARVPSFFASALDGRTDTFHRFILNGDRWAYDESLTVE